MLIATIFGALYFSAPCSRRQRGWIDVSSRTRHEYARDIESSGSPNFYSSLPAGIEMLYLFAFLIGKHSTAALIHLTFLGSPSV